MGRDKTESRPNRERDREKEVHTEKEWTEIGREKTKDERESERREKLLSVRTDI